MKAKKILRKQKYMQIAYLGQVHESASPASQPLTVLLGLGDGGGSEDGGGGAKGRGWPSAKPCKGRGGSSRKSRWGASPELLCWSVPDPFGRRWRSPA